jgi:OmcA/MtrC family decaheme c-type cytochrome
VHRLNPTTGDKLTAGTATITINSATFPPTPVAGDNVAGITVNFTFAATDSAGTNITPSIDLRTLATGSTTNLAYATFALAKLVAGTNGSANEWAGFVSDPGAGGSGPFRTIKANGVNGAIFTGTPATGVYSYTFADNAIRMSDGYVDNVVMRVTVQASSFPVTLFTSDPVLQQNANRAAANAWLDVVNPIGGGPGVAPTAAYPTRNDVTTAACNQCHDPIGAHSQSARRQTAYCVVCHNPKAEIKGTVAAQGYVGWDNVSLINLVHGIHRAQKLGNVSASDPTGWDFSEVTYPQDIRNCTTCHQGTDDFWKTRPTRYSCGSCHTNVNFATGAGHGPFNVGGIRTDDSQCTLCHTANGIVGHHADPNLTPGNVPAGLDNIVYFIDNVTVDNNVPVVGFRITKNGSPLTIPADNTGKAIPPSGYSTASSPSFLVAYTLLQDGITAPVDYNNKGRTAAQPQSVQLSKTVSTTTGAVTLGLPLTGGPSGYTARLTSAPFPAGSTFRAVALQGYFTQIVGTDNVARHAKSEMRAISTARRTVVDSDKCLSCHKTLELHGGSRVNNVQVCVMCHNPNLSSSGRTTPTPVASFNTAGGTPPAGFNANDPLSWPERTNNLKELVHGIHASEMRGAANPYTFVRLRGGTAYYFDWSEVTYPSQLRNCTKCHINGTFDADLPAGVLLTTEETSNGTNTQAGITAARGTVPNAADVVNSPTASGCGFCHADTEARSHFVLQGGQIKGERGTALIEPNPLSQP